MNYRFKTLLFKFAFFSIVFSCIIAYEFLVSDDSDLYGDLVYFNQKVKNGDVIFRTTSFKGSSVGIIEEGMFRKVYVWDIDNTIKQDLYEWAKKSEDGHVSVYRILSPSVNVHEMNQHEIDSLVHWHKLEYITASWN